MIEINLVPDLKAQFLKAQRMRDTVVSISFIVSGVFVGLVVVMLIHVNATQKVHTDNLNEDIAELTADYSAFEDLDKIITVQKQLNQISVLHEKKPLVTRIPTYLTILTPEQIELNDIKIDYETQIITMTGIGETVPDVNILADTIKKAVFTIEEKTDNEEPEVEIVEEEEVELEEFPAFNNVKLKTISTSDEGSYYELVFSFDPQLFLSNDKVRLIVPDIESTLSEQESPKTGDNQRENNLFTAPVEEDQ